MSLNIRNQADDQSFFTGRFAGCSQLNASYEEFSSSSSSDRDCFSSSDTDCFSSSEMDYPVDGDTQVASGGLYDVNRGAGGRLARPSGTSGGYHLSRVSSGSLNETSVDSVPAQRSLSQTRRRSSGIKDAGEPAVSRYVKDAGNNKFWGKGKNQKKADTIEKQTDAESSTAASQSELRKTLRVSQSWSLTLGDNETFSDASTSNQSSKGKTSTSSEGSGVYGGWRLERVASDAAMTIGNLDAKTVKTPVSAEECPDINKPPANLNTPFVRYQPTVLQLAKDVEAQLDDLQKMTVVNTAYKDYEKAMVTLEQSIADAVCSNKEIEKYLDGVMDRMEKILTAYAKQHPCGQKANDTEALGSVLATIASKTPDKMAAYAGNVGGTDRPFKILRVMREGNFRERMFLLLAAKKTVFTELLENKEMVNKVNEQLNKDGHGKIQLAYTPRIAEEGLISSQMDLQGLRVMKKQFEREEFQKLNLDSIPLDDSGKKARIPYSLRERVYQRRHAMENGKQHVATVQHAAGAKIFRTLLRQDFAKNNNGEDCPYLEVAHAARMPLIAGPSGSTDQILTVVHSMGLNKREDLFKLRLACLGWFIDTASHTAYEVLTSCQTFGLEFTASADYWKQLDPAEIGILKDIQKAQRKRGMRMPEYYLSRSYTDKVAAKVTRPVDIDAID